MGVGRDTGTISGVGVVGCKDSGLVGLVNEGLGGDGVEVGCSGIFVIAGSSGAGCDGGAAGSDSFGAQPAKTSPKTSKIVNPIDNTL